MTGPIKILLTASEDFGKAEIEITATDPQDAYAKVTGLGNVLVEEIIAQQTLLAKGLKASHGLSPADDQTPLKFEQPNPQFASSIPQQQAAQPPAWAQQQPANVVPISQGRVCESCGQPLIAKQTSAGKNVWRCDAWRWNNGNPNGHTSLKPGEGF